MLESFKRAATLFFIVTRILPQNCLRLPQKSVENSTFEAKPIFIRYSCPPI